MLSARGYGVGAVRVGMRVQHQSIASSVPVAAGGGAGRMHHAPRATRQLRFDATEWETPTIAQVAVLLFRFAEYAESAENNSWAGRYNPASFFLGL